MAKLIPAMIDQLKSHKVKQHEKEEAADEFMMGGTVDDYLKSHKVKPHKEEDTVEAAVEAAVGKPVEDDMMGAKEKKRKRRIARTAKARNDNKKKMMQILTKYKQGFEKKDSDKMEEALKDLEEIGKQATKEGDTSMAKLIPAMIDQLKSHKVKQHEKEEAADEFMMGGTVDDYLKSHKVKPHKEEDTVEAAVEAAVGKPVEDDMMGAKEKKRKRRIARTAKARNDSEKKVEDFPTIDPIPVIKFDE